MGSGIGEAKVKQIRKLMADAEAALDAGTFDRAAWVELVRNVKRIEPRATDVAFQFGVTHLKLKSGEGAALLRGSASE